VPDLPPPTAKRRPRTLTHLDDQRVDDYFWLRDREDPEVLEYLGAENEYAASELAGTDELRQTIYDEIVARIEETDVTAPVRWGPWWYYERTYESKSYPVHCRRPADDRGFPTQLDGPGEQVLLDENELAEGHDFCSVGVMEVAPGHRLCAVGVDFEGNERHTVSFLSLDGADAPPETIEDVGYSVAWSADARSILYVRVDDAWRPFELWRHELWTNASDDVLLYREDDERFRVSVARSRDDEVLVVHVGSTLTTEVRVLDATSPTSHEVLWPRRHGVECSIEHLSAPDGSRWWIATTNDAGATDFKVLAARVGAPPLAFRELVAAQPGRRVNGVDAFAHHLVVSERRDGSAAVRLLPLLDGPDPFGEDLEARGIVVGSDEDPATTAVGATPEYDSDSVRVVQTTLVSPFGSFDVALADGSRTLRKRQVVRGGYDSTRLVSSRLWVTARDGVEIPVSIVHRRELLGASGAPGDPPAAPMPLVLYGYGAYEISIDPVFSSARLSLLERGVGFAIAHVRGGGELGRSWYQAGCLEHKVTSFLDFVDVAHALVERGFTDRAHLAAIGGSAGGLLMGASVNLDPEAFCAVVAEVPFVDVLSTMLDASLPLTVGEWEEWGDPVHDPDAYHRMKAWSPYDNVVAHELDGSPRTYPDLLVLASLNDTRVQYWEPAKWVAKLRAANASNRIVLKTDLGAGHAGPSGRYDAWRERALVFAWVAERLGAGATEPVAAR
jgi:oligopeptidase B